MRTVSINVFVTLQKMSDPKPNDDKSTIERVFAKKRMITVHEAPRVYKTVKEMRKAVRKNRYEIARMFHLAKDGTLYFACLESSDEESE